ncbi:hypothetical protein GOBAR_AA36162 [Gossypium barbadense]|uniref:Uncharacterized protein n=1 Tax=Gossypium barbadense TaxID=3634 RepID=A0A2P5W0D3_GOSBA|nr:hypothetical protein GOBAR_AA36162 [Gossypium barbadense]
MDEKGISGSYPIFSEDKKDSLYPMYIGVSCAFFALRLLTGPEKEDEKWSESRDKMLHGSAQLLGLLIWRIQREEANEAQCELLRKLEIAKIEIEELKKRRHEDAKANEKVMVVESKDKVIEEMEQKGKELEEKVMEFESIAEELKEAAKWEAQEHSNELWKHKTAFIEIVSNQRRLEAEMGRAFREVEATKLELDAVLEQKEESVLLAQNLSMEIAKMRKDLEQKDKVLSAMLRKTKLDTAEKQLLLKEVKVSKTKKKQAELETERWRAVSESRHERHSLKAMFANQASAKLDASFGAKEVSNSAKTRSLPTDAGFEYDLSELKTDPAICSPLMDCNSPEMSEDWVMTTDVKRLEHWVRDEAEKYAAVIEKRHHLELDAFAEQMRLKDEKLEAFRWRLLSMELESKRMQSHAEGLNQDMSQLRQDNMKLEALLLEKEEELDSLKEQPLSCHKNNLINLSLHDPALLTHDTVWPNVKIIKKKSTDKEQETNTTLLDESQEIPSNKETKNIRLIVQVPEKEFKEQKETPKPDPVEKETNSSALASTLWRMDLQALGVSYKIKRLKQQLLLLERLTGKQETGEDTEGSSDNGMKGFLLSISLLNKQVGRYQSLQGKTDDLCKRMRYMVATGQKLMEIQPKIVSGFLGVELDKVHTIDMKRFSDNVRSLFQEVQRGLEVRIA